MANLTKLALKNSDFFTAEEIVLAGDSRLLPFDDGALVFHRMTGAPTVRFSWQPGLSTDLDEADGSIVTVPNNQPLGAEDEPVRLSGDCQPNLLVVGGTGSVAFKQVRAKRQ